MTGHPVEQNTDSEPDIVLAVLQCIHAYLPDIAHELLAKVEADIKRQYGGRRVRVLKKRKHYSAQERADIFAAGLTSATDQQIQSSTGVSRATLYRIMKDGPSRLK